MAFTLSHTANTVFGNQRIKVIRVTADAATQNVDTGLGSIIWAGVTAISNVAASTLSAGISTGWNVSINSGAGGTSLAGYLGVSNAVSGDVSDVVIFGTDL